MHFLPLWTMGCYQPVDALTSFQMNLGVSDLVPSILAVDFNLNLPLMMLILHLLLGKPIVPSCLATMAGIKKIQCLFFTNQKAFLLWVSMRIQVWSLASLSGLRIWCCCCSKCRSKMLPRSGVAVAVVGWWLWLQLDLASNFHMLQVQSWKRKKKKEKGSSHCGSAVTNRTSIHEDVGWIPGLSQWVKDLVLPWTVV